jgi:hypothetical protein
LGDAGVLFDARRQRQETLDRITFHTLACLIDEALDKDALTSRVMSELDVSERQAQASAARVYDLLVG